jgi:uncharacterized protein (DUF1800 family)
MKRSIRIFLIALTLGLAACSRGPDSPVDALSGQVSTPPTSTAPRVDHHATSRFLEHASFGPSPRSVAAVQSLGIEGWIDAQMKKPVSLVDTPVEFRDPNDPRLANLASAHHRVQIMNLIIGAEDELRVKVAWALSNFLVVSTNKIASYGGSEFFNTLLTHSFGSYGDLLKAVSRHASMGFFLDNAANRRAALNENYARELMQLFAIGLIQLNMDGTPKRTSTGALLENYTQADVVAATRALTGWSFDPRPRPDGSNGGFNYGYPMVPSPNLDDHDSGVKTIMGQTLPAGQGAEKDLDGLISLLMDHPSMAPFVSIRLIQNMTTSDPSPDYVRRVATVFRDSKGNLGQTVKAILTDPQARQADNPLRAISSFGRIKEPLMVHASLLRGMDCRLAPRLPDNPNEPWGARTQVPVAAFSVFNFHQPTHRAPGTNLLAPEEKTLDALEFGRRLGDYNSAVREAEPQLQQAGCDVDAFKAAAARGTDDLLDLLSTRYFRGRMPAAIRAGLKAYSADPWMQDQPLQRLGTLFEIMTLTPTFGATR